MIHKLRQKFIAVAMLSLFVVLLLIIGSANILNYQRILSDADRILAVLADNNGVFPINKPEIPLPVETPYESRFFSVVLDEEGNVLSIDLGRIAAVDASVALAYAQEIWSDKSQQGFMDDYRYITQERENGLQIIFLDCGRSLATFRSFLLTSIGGSVLGMLVVFLLIVLFSRRIVKPVAESYEKQKQFITDAGHEIKTPLTIIDAAAEVLQMDFGQNEWLDEIQNQTKRMTVLTNDLIFLARMEEEQNHLLRIDFPLSDVVAEVAQSFQAPAKIQRKSFSSYIQPMLSLCGDEKAIRQLLSILLDNAFKYSNEGGRISLKLEKRGKALALEIFNTVESIDKAQLPHLFDRFYRLDTSRNSQTGGHGIGLAMAQAIVTAHKGRITATTQDGKSLLISVSFPI